MITSQIIASGPCGKPLRDTAGSRGEPKLPALRDTAGDAGHLQLSACNCLRDTAGNRCGKPIAGYTCGRRGTPAAKCLISFAGYCGEPTTSSPPLVPPLQGGDVGDGQGWCSDGVPHDRRRGDGRVAQKARIRPAGPSKGASPPRGFSRQPHPPAEPHRYARRSGARPMIKL